MFLLCSVGFCLGRSGSDKKQLGPVEKLLEAGKGMHMGSVCSTDCISK